MFCQRCKQNFIDEEYEKHVCTSITTKLQEIGLDYMLEPQKNEDFDDVYIGKGLNGILYRFVVCEHNPIHTNDGMTQFESEVVKNKFERSM